MSNKMQDRREVILDTALYLFTKHGYFNTSVHDIQKQAKVSIGSIYHHFNNKEAIAKALFDSLAQKMTDAFTNIIQIHQTAHDRCKAVVSYLFEITEKEPSAMQYMLYAKHREFMPKEKPVCSSKPFEMMKHMVIEGMESGEIREMDPNIAATSVFGGPIRLIYLRLDKVLKEDLTCCLDESWNCSWKAVKA